VKLSVQNEPEKFHEMGEPHVIFMKLCFTLYVHSMYSKGNEQVLGKEQVLKGKQNPLSCFVFVLILDVFRAENLFCFSPGNEFLFLLYV
jgi:hypothetical protein